MRIARALACALCALALTRASGSAVTYLDESGAIATASDCTTLANGAKDAPATWGIADATTWYVAPGRRQVQFPCGVVVTGDVRIVLSDSSVLAVGTEKWDTFVPGIRVTGEGSRLTIYAQSQGAGAGKLTAIGGTASAGIGGGKNQSGSHIAVYGGTIIAKGQQAGIGGGLNGDGFDIVIAGGDVTATSVDHNSAGIGGGNGGAGYDIEISGGKVYASSSDAAGIGGGSHGVGHHITVSGGTVTAEGGLASAGIGGGDHAEGRDLTISGGMVTATGGKWGAGVGGGCASAARITLSGGQLVATGGRGAAAVGGGYGSAGHDIALDGGRFSANVEISAVPLNGIQPSALGGGEGSSGSSVSVPGGATVFVGKGTDPDRILTDEEAAGDWAAALAGWERVKCAVVFSMTASTAFTLEAPSPAWNGTISYSLDAETWSKWDGSPITGTSIYLSGSGNTHLTDVNGEPWTLTGTGVAFGGSLAVLFDEKVSDPSAIVMDPYACRRLFAGCTALVEASTLPMRNLSEGCYAGMFEGCASLEKAPALPAVALAPSCYASMFEGCTSLVTAPELGARQVTTNCYEAMFRGCTALRAVPDLSASVLAPSCYEAMFEGCTALTEPLALLAETLAARCYADMFKNCTGITIFADGAGKRWTLPARAAVSVSTEWNAGLFAGTSGTFTGDPEIGVVYFVTDEPMPPVEILPYDLEHATWKLYSDGTQLVAGADGKYTLPQGMPFEVVYTLEYGWEMGLDTFVYTNATTATSDPTRPPVDRMPPVTRVVALEFACDAPIVLSMRREGQKIAGQTRYECPKWSGTLEYRAGNGPWTVWDPDVQAAVLPALTASGTERVDGRFRLSLRGTDNSCFSRSDGIERGTYLGIAMSPEDGSSPIDAAGDIRILLDYATIRDGGDVPLAEGAFKNLFAGTLIRTPPELPSLRLAPSCYYHMFYHSAVTNAPALPAMELADSCYSYMFTECTYLERPCELPAVEMKPSCYMHMFSWTLITNAPALPATKLADSCYRSMFYGCSLLKWPCALPAVEMERDCYRTMFFLSGVVLHWPGKGNIWSLPENLSTATDWGYGMFERDPTYSTAPVPGRYYYSESAPAVNIPVCTPAVPDGGGYHWRVYLDDGTEVSPDAAGRYNILTNGIVTFQAEAECGYLFDGEDLWGATYSARATANPTMLEAPGFKAPRKLAAIRFQEEDRAFGLKLNVSAMRDSFSSGGTLEFFGADGWKTYTAEASPDLIEVDSVLQDGAHCIYMRGTGLKRFCPDTAPPSFYYFHHGDYVEAVLSFDTHGYASTPQVSVYGDFNSLLDYATVERGDCPLRDPYTFAGLFVHVRGLCGVETLPSCTPAEYAYAGMFFDCTSLTDAPRLPASKLAPHAYESLFAYCSALAEPPEISATTLAEKCCFYMFRDCTALAHAPVLPATQMAESCYEYMFNGCTALKYPAEVPPGTVLAPRCFLMMYYDTGLPLRWYSPQGGRIWSIPSDVVVCDDPLTGQKDISWCVEMFNSTISDSTTYGEPIPGKYYSFFGAGSLNSFSFQSDSKWDSEKKTYFRYFADGESSSYDRDAETWIWADTLVRIELWSTPDRYFPSVQSSRKAVVYVRARCADDIYAAVASISRDEDTVSPPWLVLSSETEGLSFGPSSTGGNPWNGTMECSPDGGNWTVMKHQGATAPAVAAFGEKQPDGRYYAVIRGTGNTYVTGRGADFAPWAFPASSHAFMSEPQETIDASGALAGMLDWETVAAGSDPEPDPYAFFWLFSCDPSEVSYIYGGGASVTWDSNRLSIKYRRSLHDISRLILPKKLSQAVLAEAFRYTYVVNTPEFPDSDVSEMAYWSMFDHCSKLVVASALPSRKVGECAYVGMFSECEKLRFMRDDGIGLPTLDVVNDAYRGMFYGCSALERLPRVSGTCFADGALYFLADSTPVKLYTTGNPCGYTWMLNEKATYSGSNWNKSVVPNASGYDVLANGKPLPGVLYYLDPNVNAAWDPVRAKMPPDVPHATCTIETPPFPTGRTRAPDDERGREFPRHWIVRVIYAAEDGYLFSDGTVRYEYVRYLDADENDLALENPPVALKSAHLAFSSPYPFSLSYTSPKWDGTMQISDVNGLFQVWDGSKVQAVWEGDRYRICLRGMKNTIVTGPDGGSMSVQTSSGPGGSVSVSGSFASLLDYALVANKRRVVGNDYCFKNLFNSSSSLGDASRATIDLDEIPAGGCREMFRGCPNLKAGPVLPAKSVGDEGYACMFMGSALTNAPALPATTIGAGVYTWMFAYVPLTSPPELPATTVQSNCYSFMFCDCPSLTSAPALPATIMAADCYRGMFLECDKLVSPPALPARTLAPRCYFAMFRECTALKTAPVLPARKMAERAYSEMFYYCRNLARPPELPATRLAPHCYENMFNESNKFGLFEASMGEGEVWSIPADAVTTGADDWGKNMFHEWGLGIDGVHMNTPTTPVPGVEYYLKFGVPQTVYIRVPPDVSKMRWRLATTDDDDVKRISCFDPIEEKWYSSWIVKEGRSFTVYAEALPGYIFEQGEHTSLFYSGKADKNADPQVIPYEDLPVAPVTDACVAFSAEGDFSVKFVGKWDKTLEYSCDGRVWAAVTKDATYTAAVTGHTDDSGVKHGRRYLLFRGTGNCYCNASSDSVFEVSGSNVSVYGNTASLLDWQKVAAGRMPENADRGGLRGLFARNDALTDASALTMPVCNGYCYANAFEKCTKLVRPPVLPSVKLAEGCYWQMFVDCTALTEPPNLPASEMEDSCYSRMFYGCTALTRPASASHLSSLADSCFGEMYANCSSLYLCTEGTGFVWGIPFDVAGTDSAWWGDKMFYAVPGGTLMAYDGRLPVVGQWYYSVAGTLPKVKVTVEAPPPHMKAEVYEDKEKLSTAPSTAYFQTNAWLTVVYTAEPGWGFGASREPQYRYSFRADSDSMTVSAALAPVPYEAPNRAVRFASEAPFALAVGTKGWDGTIETSTDGINWSVWDGTSVSSAESFGTHYLLLRGKDNTVLTSGSDLNAYANYAFRLTSATDTPVSASGNLHALLDYTRTTAGERFVAPAYACVGLFAGNALLVSGPDLDAPVASSSAYVRMYADSGIRTPPELLPTVISNFAYMSMFENCRKLETAPALPATELSDLAYYSLFSGCEALTQAPELPASIVPDYAYASMFQGCKSLNTPPVLPAKKLADGAYSWMFKSCSALAYAPLLPAETLSSGVYASMFEGCTALTAAPVLPAVELADSCYEAMFNGCTALSAISKLPAAKLMPDCYADMFKGCKSLKLYASGTGDIWQIPYDAQTAADWNRDMFKDTGGTFAGSPVPGAYYFMTPGETQYVKVTPPPERDHTYWKLYTNGVEIVEANGVYAVVSNAQVTVMYSAYPGYAFEGDAPVLTNAFAATADPTSVPTEAVPLGTFARACFTFRSAGSFKVKMDGGQTWDGRIEASTDGIDWNIWDGTALTAVRAGDGVYYLLMRGTLNTRLTGSSPAKGFVITDASKTVSVPGRVEVLLDYETVRDGGLPSTDIYALSRLFKDCTAIEEAPVVGLDVLTKGCCREMFAGCTKLAKPPELPARTLGEACYEGLLKGCTALKTPPVLYAASLPKSAYRGLFENCTALTNAPALPATTLGEGVYESMFAGCTFLATAPDLSAPSRWTASACKTMFKGCTALATAPALTQTVLAESCYESMFENCTGLTRVPKLDASPFSPSCYKTMFKGCTGIKLYASGTGEKWYVPNVDAEDAADWNKDMFAGTGGSFKGSPEAGAYFYYTYAAPTYVTVSVSVAAPDHAYWTLFTNGVELAATLSASWKVAADTPVVLSVHGLPGYEYRTSPATFRSRAPSSGSAEIPVAKLPAAADEAFVLGFRSASSFSLNAEKAWAGSLETSSDCVKWTTWAGASVSSAHVLDAHYLFVRGSGNTMLTKISDLDGAVARKPWVLTGSNIDAFGSVDTLFDYATCAAGGEPTRSAHAATSLFQNNTCLRTPPRLPAKSVTKNGYAYMFAGCTGLKRVPALPATSLAEGCYRSMFDGCTAITNGPTLPAETVQPCCYEAMFRGCKSLVEPPVLTPRTLANACYREMFKNCTSLPAGPSLPATILADNCYCAMYEGCTALTDARTLPANFLKTSCYYAMFRKCTSLRTLPSLDACNLAKSCYAWMFEGCSSVKLWEPEENNPYAECWAIPSEVDLASCGDDNPFFDILKGTGGGFTGTPVPGKCYFYHRTQTTAAMAPLMTSAQLAKQYESVPFEAGSVAAEATAIEAGATVIAISFDADADRVYRLETSAGIGANGIEWQPAAFSVDDPTTAKRAVLQTGENESGTRTIYVDSGDNQRFWRIKTE